MLHGHGAADDDADRELLRGRSLYTTGHAVLRSGDSHDADCAGHLHGLRAGLYEPARAIHGDGAELRDASRRPLRDALRSGQADLHAPRRQGALGGQARAGVRTVPAGANLPLLGAELGQRGDGSYGQQDGDGAGALHVPGDGLQARGADAHSASLPLREPDPHLHAQIHECHYETRTRTVPVTECQFVPRSRQVPCTTYVPKTEYHNVQVTECEMRPSEREVHYTEMVPHEVQRTIQVCVCHMVQKQVQVPVCQPCCPAPCCPRRCCRNSACGCGC